MKWILVLVVKRRHSANGPLIIMFSQCWILLWVPVVFHYKLIWPNNLTNELCDFWKRSLDERWQFLFRSGLWKKIYATLATEGTMAVLARSRQETLNDFEYLFPLMRRGEPDNWWILLLVRKTRTFLVYIWKGATYDAIPELKFDENSLMV